MVSRDPGPVEMRVFNQPQQVTERIGQLGHEDAFAHFLDVGVNARSQRNNALHFLGNVVHAPIGLDAVLDRFAIRYQAQFETADFKADVEGLVEVGFGLENFAVPGFAGFQVGGRVNRGAQAFDHGVLLYEWWMGASCHAARTADWKNGN